MAGEHAEIVIAPPFQALTDAQQARIRQAAGKMSCRFVDPADLDAAASGAEVVACLHSHGLGFLTRTPRPKWVHSWSAGVDEMSGPEVVDSGVLLTCAKSNGAIALGEHALMLMLMLQRNMLQWLDNQRRGEWSKHIIGELYGKTCGIIGLGYIGKETALRAKAFGMRTIGIKRTRAAVANVDEVKDRGVDIFVDNVGRWRAGEPLRNVVDLAVGY